MIILRTKCKKANGHSTREKFYTSDNMKELIDKIKLIVLDMYHDSIKWEDVTEESATIKFDKGMEILAIKEIEEFATVTSDIFSGTVHYGFMVEEIQPEK